MILQTLRITTLLGVLATAVAVWAQAPPPPPPAKPASEQDKTKPAKKAKKVWTDDDLKGLRKPSDEASGQKQAPEEAAKPAEASEKDKAANPEEEASSQPPINPLTGKPYEDADSPAKLEKDLEDMGKGLDRIQDLLRQAREEMASAPDDERYELARLKVENYEADIPRMQKEMEDMRARLEAAKKGKSGAKPEATPAPPAPPQP